MTRPGSKTLNIVVELLFRKTKDSAAADSDRDSGSELEHAEERRTQPDARQASGWYIHILCLSILVIYIVYA
jgi:hypothetical protein